ncbi:MAG: LpqB family beta-propeller domain-containing protein [Streptosporangiaceae bacterium]
MPKGRSWLAPSWLAPSWLAPSWLARCRLAFVLAAAAASVAGCVGMPNSGSPGTVGASPQNTSQDSDFIGAIPAGPQKGWSPTDIVKGYLNASIGYPSYQDIAREYLASAPDKPLWNSNWSVKVVEQVNVQDADFSPGGRTAAVDVTGAVLASFNGSGQYVGAQGSRTGGQPDDTGTQSADQQFTLAKVNGQWRITNAPDSFRMLTQPDFAKVYRAQDLYFFDPTDQVLVPDSVFVPTGTSPSSLVRNLVNALLNIPQAPWLKAQGNPLPPAVTAFPLHTKVLGVTVDGTTATVNLGGPAVSATPQVRQQMATQLVWTLAGQAGNPQNAQNPPSIQAVLLEINGKPWSPSAAACPDTGGQSQSPAQKLLMYGCRNPYPAATSSAFFYTVNGQAWTRCASQSQVISTNVGVIQPVFGKTGAASLNPACPGTSVQASASPVPPSQTHQAPPLTMVAVSSDGKYLAGYSPQGNSLLVWAANQAKPTSTIPLSGVTSIGWDRRDYLWVAQGDITTVVAQTGGSKPSAQIMNNFPGKILGFGIAPDGVRVAAIVQAGSGPEVELAAINSGLSPSSQPSAPFDRMSIGQPVQLAPNVTNPVALTWYNADNLLVLDGTGSQTSLWEVPVDGQPATKLPGVLPGAISITANTAQNVLVAGLTDNRMEVSAAPQGPWQLLGGGGQNPAFQIPLPFSAQS